MLTAGAVARFCVVTKGGGTIAYQWQHDGTPIAGEIGDSLIIEGLPINLIDYGNYTVVVSNEYGSVTSGPATIFPDSDGDGMPDTWEIQNFGTLNSLGGGDTDGDRISNYDEYFNASNPNGVDHYLNGVASWLYNDLGAPASNWREICHVGDPFSFSISSTNHPTQFTATGLPAGLSINPTSGLISGAPTVPGVFVVSLGATTAYGPANGTLTLTVLGVGEFHPDLHLRLKLDEVSGTTAADSSENGFSGTTVNGPVWTTGQINNAMEFNGPSAQYLTLPEGLMVGVNDCTISTWVKMASFDTWARIFDFGTGTDNYMFLTAQYGVLPHESAKLLFSIRTPAVDVQQIYSSVALAANTWTHVALTLSGGSGTLYVNGNAAGTNSGMTLNPSDLGTTNFNYLGKSQFNDPYLNGTIDDFRIYRRALSAEEIATFQAPLPAPQNLEATSSDRQSTLSWSAVSNAKGYVVRRSVAIDGPYSVIASPATPGFNDTGLTNGVTYYYTVSARNFTDDGALSPAAAVSLPLLAPLGLTVTPGIGETYLSWNPANGAAFYTIERASAPGGPYTPIVVGWRTTSFKDTSVNPGTTYYYRVSSGNGIVASAASSGASAVPGGVAPFLHLRFDESTGTLAADSSGQNRTGTLSGGASFSAGRIRNAVNLDGGNQLVTLPAGVVSGLNDFTIAAWVKPDSLGTWARIFDFGTGTDNYIQLVALNGFSNTFSFSIRTPATSDQYIISTTPLPIGVWSHVAVSLAGNSATLYLNGISVGTNNAVTLRPANLGVTTQNFIGDSQFGADPTFDGLIDEFHIFDHALTATQVEKFVKLPPVVHLRFDESNGTKAADSSGYGWDGTLEGGPTFVAGRVNRAVNLDGADQHIAFPAGVVSSCNDFTITAWVKPDNLGTWARIFDFGTGTNNFMHLIALNGFTNSFSFSIRTPTTPDQFIDSNTALPSGVWSHVAVSLSGNSATLYLNGVSVGTNNSVTLRPSDLGITTQNFIGDSQFAADPSFDGLIDDFQIFDRALAEAEIVTLAGPVPKLHLRFDEITGTMAADSSGFGWNGSLANGATFAAGRINRAVDLGGGDQRVELLPGVVSSLNDFTLAAWVRPDSLGTWARIWDFGTDTNNFINLVALNGLTNKLTFGIRTPSTYQSIESSLPLTVGQWSHVAVTLSGNSATLYLNGNPVGSNNSMTLRPSDLGITTQNYLGDSQYAADPGFDGQIDEFQIFNRALTGADVAMLAIPPAIETWRQTWFGTTTNLGNAADHFDYDNDGLVNLLEFAFGLNPVLHSSGQLPSLQAGAGTYGFSFSTPPGVSGITYGAEWSATMAAGDWHAIPDSGTGAQHTFSVPANGNLRFFVRLKVAGNP